MRRPCAEKQMPGKEKGCYLMNNSLSEVLYV